VAAACVLALGLASGIPVLLQRPLIYEVMVSCGFAMFMLALASVYRAMESPSRRGWWLAAAGVFYGLAVGSRPALLTGSVILAIPVLKAWRTTEMDSRPRRSIGTLAAAAAAPLALIVTGLLFYNFLRFGSPLAFGQRYQLMYTPSRSAQPSFSLRFLWFNLRAYFLAPAGLEPRFPFVRDIAAGPLPFGHYGVESPYGVLTNIPVTWLALAAPLALRRQAGRTPLGLGWLLGALALYVGALSLTLGCYFAACGRYEVDFLPSLILLAVFGVLGLESALEERRVWRLAARCAWGTLLAVSIAFNVLASFQHHAEQHVTHGRMMLPLHRYADAIADFQEALRLRPGYLEARLGLADAHDQAGNRSGAVVEWEEILRQDPGCADAENMLGRALSGDDRAAEAIPHLERAVRLNPGSPDAENNLGSALVASGRGPEAIAHFESALRLNPSLGEAENNLGLALVGMGRWEQAISHFETALSVRPELGEAHGNLGFVLARIGRRSEAIAHLKQALEFTPDNADDRYLLGVELGLVGSKEEAIDQLRRALRIKPGFPAADRALKALQPAGR
jgi:tetratricopeptide (TPR) repeat protein